MWGAHPENAFGVNVAPVFTHLSASEERRLRALSFWWHGLPGPLLARRALAADIDVDVAVVGAGFSGLWAAYYLLRASPGLRVAVMEKKMRVAGMLGATYTLIAPLSTPPSCQGTVERLARSISTAKVSLARVRTNGAWVRADVVISALEGWTPSVPEQRRALLPVYSLMIATEPLPDGFWSEAGLARRETFSDHRHLIIYGQRTADGRLAFGGRGRPVPLRLGRTSLLRPLRPSCTPSAPPTLVELFPALSHAAVTHAWGGPLGVPATGPPRWGSTGHGDGMGRRLRGRRRVDHQPRRADAGRTWCSAKIATWSTCRG